MDYDSVPAKTSSPFVLSVDRLKCNHEGGNTNRLTVVTGECLVCSLAQSKCSYSLNTLPSNGFAKLALC